MSGVYITDYIENADIERKILKDKLNRKLSEQTEVLMIWHKIIDAEFMDQLPNLKGIVRYGVGFDNVDIQYARSRGIVVCNTPDYGVDEVSDTTIAMLMNITRGISRYDFLCRSYKDSWQENTITNLQRSFDITLGVIGAGRIGGSVLLKANALGFNTVFFDPYRPSGYEKMLNSKRVYELDTLLKNSDVVSFNAPLTRETEGLINNSFVASMKMGASLINTARGGVIEDIDIFYEALKQNHLYAISLDVLPEEPPKTTSKLLSAWRQNEEWLAGRLLINPHVAYYSQQAFIEMRRKAAENALRILHGEPPLNVVN